MDMMTGMHSMNDLFNYTTSHIKDKGDKTVKSANLIVDGKAILEKEIWNI